MGECKLMMVSHGGLVAMWTYKNNNMLISRGYSRYVFNEFEYGVKRWNVGNWISFPNIQFLFIEIVNSYVKFEFFLTVVCHFSSKI
jgi:hypothetical protein